MERISVKVSNMRADHAKRVLFTLQKVASSLLMNFLLTKHNIDRWTWVVFFVMFPNPFPENNTLIYLLINKNVM